MSPLKRCSATVRRGAVLALASAGALSCVLPAAGSRRGGAQPAPEQRQVQPPEAPLVSQFTRRAHVAGPVNVDASDLMRAMEARTHYSVSGAGLAVAVLDTGLRVTHQDFAGRVVAPQNFTDEDGGNSDVVEDGNGHGTNVAGIVAAGGAIHTGIAPGATVVPCKVLPASGSGSFAGTLAALNWVIENHATYHISVVNISLGDGLDHTRVLLPKDPLLQRILTLRKQRVATCAAAGNEFGRFKSRTGMAYPAITPHAISVGAVYDRAFGVSSLDGAVAYSTGPDRVAAFSQRLFTNSISQVGTDLFAPGAPIESAGSSSDDASSIYQGTSQATPMVAGVILLMQEYALRTTGSLPTVDQLEKWLRAGAVAVKDGDNEKDNVRNTGKSYRRVDALGAFRKMVAGL